jgi:nuclear GTP-binding protein
VESLVDPSLYIAEVLNRIKPEYIQKTYGVSHWENSTDFLQRFARLRGWLIIYRLSFKHHINIFIGKIVKGGEPDFNNVARTVLQDWQRGRLPWFCPPTVEEEQAAEGGSNANCNEDLKLRVLQIIDKIPTNAEFENCDMEEG